MTEIFIVILSEVEGSMRFTIATMERFFAPAQNDIKGVILQNPNPLPSPVAPQRYAPATSLPIAPNLLKTEQYI